MKINEGFVLREIYGQYLLVPILKNELGNEIILINEVGADIWRLALAEIEEDEIINNILKEYRLEVSSVEAESVRAFISTLCEKKILIV